MNPVNTQIETGVMCWKNAEFRGAGGFWDKYRRTTCAW